MEKRESASSPPERSLALAPPEHMKHVTSLLSMEGFSDGSLSDGDSKSRSSGIGLDLGSPRSTPGPSECDTEVESGPLCGGTVNLKEYVSDLTMLSHAAVVGDVPKGEKASPFEGQPPKELDASITDTSWASTYERWKKLSGPIILFLVLGLVVLIWGRTHLVQLLQWLERLPLHLSLLVFIVLFTLISFPFGFGYIILNMTAGYLYGILHGQLIVMVSVGVGLTVSFLLCRSWLKDYAKGMVTSNALQAVIRVVEGPHGFKVIFLTRFTPIPFGLQNVLFAMTSVSYWQFFLASALGLLPTQVLNTYMGSTVRSMQEVLTDRMDGYIILGVQVVFSLVLMLYLLNKARRELAKLTMQNREGEP